MPIWDVFYIYQMITSQYRLPKDSPEVISGPVMFLKIPLGHLLKFQVNICSILSRLCPIRMHVRTEWNNKTILLTVLPVATAPYMMPFNWGGTCKIAVVHIFRETAP